jgi:hypothetical protein
MKMSVAVVAVWLSFSSPASKPVPAPAPAKCCSECGGTGMVWTGDRLARVHCPCPPTCPCAKNRPRMSSECKDGKCVIPTKGESRAYQPLR